MGLVAKPSIHVTKATVVRQSGLTTKPGDVLPEKFRLASGYTEQSLKA